MNEYKICKRCIMDTSDPQISFNDKGICNHCISATELLKQAPYGFSKKEKEKDLSLIINKIKRKSKKNGYDCIIGVSGGVDSTYVAYLVKQKGLNPLAVHFDNGWNSELANKNIENICNKLGIDLFTYVVNWEEFKDLQLSFLKASTPDSEIPTDHAIFALLYKQAIKWKTKYIILGLNLSTEAILPKSWAQGHQDWKYIKSVQNKFGTKKLKTYPRYNFVQTLFWRITRRFYKINILDYVDYNKDEAMKIIKTEIDWQDYGGKHLESNYTKIFQSYILPVKFGYDKRRAHLSSLIVSNQISRETAIACIKEEVYESKNIDLDIEYLINKFNISKQDFDNIMNDDLKTIHDYPNYYDSWYYRFIRSIYRTAKSKK